MKSENIKKITNEAIEQLVSTLNAGRSEALTQYLAAMARFRTYSFLNVLLILRACPTARRVAGYQTWQSFGRQVKRGEKGIMILAPMFRKQTKQVPEADSEDNSEGRALSGFRAVYVWDEQQTSGQPLPEIGGTKGDPGSFLPRLEHFVRSNGIELRYSGEIAPALGIAEQGRIILRPDLSPAEAFATLVHEIAHSDLHFGQRRAETDKRIRETEAESVAHVVCTAIGLEVGTSSSDYIGLYGGDAQLILASLEHVRTTACRILDAIEFAAEQKAAA